MGVSRRQHDNAFPYAHARRRRLLFRSEISGTSPGHRLRRASRSGRRRARRSRSRRARCRRSGGSSAEAGIALDDVTAILLTHIHLDHAGATGTLVRENPAAARLRARDGAPHLADPGEADRQRHAAVRRRDGRLWGEFAPVPRDAMVTLRGGERIEAGGRDAGRRLHARPRVAPRQLLQCRHRHGVCRRHGGRQASSPNGYVLPPTPPPDIDLEIWGESLTTHRALAPGHAVPDALRSARRRRSAPGRAPRAPRSGRPARRRQSLDAWTATTTRQRSVVRRAAPARAAPASERRRGARVRGRRPIRSELAGLAGTGGRKASLRSLRSSTADHASRAEAGD